MDGGKEWKRQGIKRRKRERERREDGETRREQELKGYGREGGERAVDFLPQVQSSIIAVLT